MLPFASFYVAPGDPNSHPCVLLTETSGLQFEGQEKNHQKMVCEWCVWCVCVLRKSLGTKAQSGTVRRQVLASSWSIALGVTEVSPGWTVEVSGHWSKQGIQLKR